MTAPYQRRRDPQPIGQGWEVVVAVLGSVLLGAALAALTGLGVASLLFGGGWVWPQGADNIKRVLGGLLAGRPGRGLPVAQLHLVASAGAVYACVAASELVLIVVSVVVGVVIARYRRPGDARGGMATRSEAAQVLGIARLRSAKEIIRPDLYGGPRPVDTITGQIVRAVHRFANTRIGRPQIQPRPPRRRSRRSL